MIQRPLSSLKVIFIISLLLLLLQRCIEAIDYSIPNFQRVSRLVDSPWDPIDSNKTRMASSSKSKRKRSRRMASLDCSINGGSNYKFSEDFPRDIMFDILSRLAGDTLIRLRSVCKLWNKLIRDPYFVDLHLSKWMHVPPSHVIAESYTACSRTSGLVLVDGIGEEGGLRARQIQAEYLLGNDHNLKLVGSCNGLICMAPMQKLDHVFICNPITGERLCLPKSKIANEFAGIGPCRIVSLLYRTVGFGFDHATRKFKVVRVLSSLENDENQLMGEIITLGESSWRKLDIPVGSSLWFNYKPMFFHGLLYWIANQLKDRRGDDFILAFDIGSEKFDIIKASTFVSEVNFQVINMEGSLALATGHYYASDHGMRMRRISKIWRLVGSMAMGFSFEQSSCDISYPDCYGLLSALLSDGTLLLNCSGHLRHWGHPFSLASYHPKKKRYLPYKVSSGFPHMEDPVLFMPSLVSLNDIC